jgi:hypothetical protein
VAAAYGWPADIAEEEALAKLLDLNLARAAATGPAPANDAEEDELNGNGDDAEAVRLSTPCSSPSRSVRFAPRRRRLNRERWAGNSPQPG